MSDLDGVPMPTVEEARAIQLQIADLEGQLGEGKARPSGSGGAGFEWTDQAGMVQQQRSAMHWVKATQRENDRAQAGPEAPPSPTPPPSPSPSGGRDPPEDKPSFYEDLYPDKDFDRDR